jgi:phosphatidylserine/phosphatidylglycerophosphate/cardiolipin synthase-like enzyme
MALLRATFLLIGCALIAPAGAFEPANVIQATGTIEYALTPGDDAAGLIVRTIDAASSQVLVQAFSFTHRDIADALIRAHRRGVDVQIIADREQTDSTESAAMRSVLNAGLSVFADGQHSAAHNKVIVIDPYAQQPALIAGSFNFTFAAQYRNAENVLVFRGNRALTHAFHANWRHHREHAVAVARGQSK